jgi:5,5'-dehydrodivanillate O-demethylase
VKHSSLFEADGKLIADTIPKQDMIGWVGQGPVSDRTREHLTASDKGVILYHKLLSENIEMVARGEDPLGIIRDPAENDPIVNLRREFDCMRVFDTKYGNYFEEIRELADIRG